MIRNVNKLLTKRSRNKQIDHFDTESTETLQNNFDENIAMFRSLYHDCADVTFHPFFIFDSLRAMLIYIDGLIDEQRLDENIIRPLSTSHSDDQKTTSATIEKVITISQIEQISLLKDCIEAVAQGNVLLLYEGEAVAFSLGVTSPKTRDIQEPQAESTIRGSREGFVESLPINLSLIRRIIKSPALKVRTKKIGKYTKTDVSFSYIDGIASQALIEEVERRLDTIDVDSILESESIEELIEDSPYSPFPQILSTERPDVVAAALLEGRVAIFTDRTPFVLIAPVSLFSFFQTPDDYYQRFLVSSMIRLLRNLFIVISLTFPALYVAITTFHQEMLPAALLLTIASARETVPFPALLEVIFMETMFEALREAGIRLPNQIGSAVSIVGALVIGQAAVQAGIVSSPMIIVVASTGIASFLIPRYNIGYSFRLLRFPIIFLAAMFGLLGIMMGLIAIMVHLCSLRSFGQPYMSPLVPLHADELKDTLWRAPFWMMNQRPKFTGDRTNKIRQGRHQAPSPPQT